MNVSLRPRRVFPLVIVGFLFLLVLASSIGSRILDWGYGSVVAQAGGPTTLRSVDVELPSESTGVDGGTLAVRVHSPMVGEARYPEGAPVLIWVQGGFEIKGIDHGLPPTAVDVICITFVFPGGEDPWSGLASDGVYDYRGPSCIAALRDVILYAANRLRDTEGRTIDQIVPVPVLHDNIGLIGESNGGNLLPAVAALHGEALAGHLRYVIQWETPVSSQIATRDLGRVWLKPVTGQGDYWNPRAIGYDPLVLRVDYGDLAYDPAEEIYPLFHDGNGDGRYTTVPDSVRGADVPDLNGTLSLSEDFPLDTYPVDGERKTYSRPVMHEIVDRGLVGEPWPSDLVSVDEADEYWDLRESVRLTEEAVAKIPDLAAMVLCNARDHVQAAPTKPHVRQAFDSWDTYGAWVKINPSSEALAAVDPRVIGGRLPNLPANTAPDDWTDHATYAIPVDVPKAIYQLAGIYEMADRVQATGLRAEPRAVDENLSAKETITFVESEGIGRIAVAIRTPSSPRYSDGAPVLVNVSGFFAGSAGFDFELDPNALGAIYVTYLWPGRSDPRTGAHSEGTFDYGGRDCLRALCDVVRFATGEIENVDGERLDELVEPPVLYDVSGLYAFSHSGIVATNVLALHGEDLQRVRFFVGRENPTIDPMYPLEPGHWDDETGRAVQNPFYDPSGYMPATISIDYSSVYWLQNEEYPDGRPAFRTSSGGDYICSFKHPRMWEKDYWSTDLLQALLDNGALTRETWPKTLALPEEAAAYWPSRTTVGNYPRLGRVLPDLRVMLVFAADDHVQTAIDKPHIHQAYDGFHETARLWCRLNPDRAYVDAFAGERRSGAVPDHPANREPATWMVSRTWGYDDRVGGMNVLVPLAAVAEMCDRTYSGEWSADLDEVLHAFKSGEVSSIFAIRLSSSCRPVVGSFDADAFAGLGPRQSQF